MALSSCDRTRSNVAKKIEHTQNHQPERGAAPAKRPRMPSSARIERTTLLIFLPSASACGSADSNVMICVSKRTCAAEMK